MDFFSQQDKARRSTAWLIALFIIAVVTLIAITNLLVGLVLWAALEPEPVQAGVSAITQLEKHQIQGVFSWANFLLVSLIVCAVIAGAVLWKWWELSAGGKAVAESLGGQRILPNTDTEEERQLLNVVEEMAIASGMPVPPVYLMEHEAGINAFAAGNTPADAVIGVTKGALQNFKRDELQGVMAHEFSHILNGDMRLNMKLIAVLYGVECIGHIGEVILRSGSSRRRDGTKVAIIGLVLMLLGWLGTFAGSIIRAAVSRQREFLADASAVQFTRNPNGIANALKRIDAYASGTEITNPHRSEVSHMFFGQSIAKLGSLLATHPPLLDRILLLDPNWDGNFVDRRSPAQMRVLKAQQSAKRKAKLEEKRAQKEQLIQEMALASTGVDLGAHLTDKQLNDVREEINGIPALLYKQAHEPLGAVALSFALLLSKDDALCQQQMGLIKHDSFEGVEALLHQLKPELAYLKPEMRLPLIELLLPALKCMSAPQYKQFRHTLMALIRADKQTDLFEWCLYQLIKHYLAPEFLKVKSAEPKYKQVAPLAHAYQMVLSVIVHYGHTAEQDQEAAFFRGAGAAGLHNIKLLPKEACHVDAFIKGVHKISFAYPLLKPRLIIGLQKCIAHDGVVSPTENEMLASIAAVMGTPLPSINLD